MPILNERLLADLDALAGRSEHGWRSMRPSPWIAQQWRE
jgi:hypothetical protein